MVPAPGDTRTRRAGPRSRQTSLSSRVGHRATRSIINNSSIGQLLGSPILRSRAHRKKDAMAAEENAGDKDLNEIYAMCPTGGSRKKLGRPTETRAGRGGTSRSCLRSATTARSQTGRASSICRPPPALLETLGTLGDRRDASRPGRPANRCGGRRRAGDADRFDPAAIDRATSFQAPTIFRRISALWNNSCSFSNFE